MHADRSRMTKAPIIASHSGVRALLQPLAQPGRRAAPGAGEERRRGADGGVPRLREVRSGLRRRARAGDRGAEPGVRDHAAPAVVAVAAAWWRRGATRTDGGRRRASRAAPPRGAPRGGITADRGSSSSRRCRRSRAQSIARGCRRSRRSIPMRPDATVKDFVDHIDYAVKLIGLDHVGISSDFDGGGGLADYNCALESVNVTAELLRRGYTEEQIAKIWSGNLLRVMSEVERGREAAAGWRRRDSMAFRKARGTDGGKGLKRQGCFEKGRCCLGCSPVIWRSSKLWRCGRMDSCARVRPRLPTILSVAAGQARRDQRRAPNHLQFQLLQLCPLR